MDKSSAPADDPPTHTGPPPKKPRSASNGSQLQATAATSSQNKKYKPILLKTRKNIKVVPKNAHKRYSLNSIFNANQKCYQVYKPVKPGQDSISSPSSPNVTDVSISSQSIKSQEPIVPTGSKKPTVAPQTHQIAKSKSSPAKSKSSPAESESSPAMSKSSPASSKLSPAKLQSAIQPVKKSQTEIECIDVDQLESQDEVQSSPAKLESAFQPVKKSQTKIECIDVDQLESQDEIQSSPAKLKSAFQPVKKSQTEIECIDVDQLESQDEIQSSPAKLKSAFQPVKKSQTEIECIDVDQLESQDEIQSSPAKLKSAFQPVKKSQTNIECIDEDQLESQDEIQSSPAKLKSAFQPVKKSQTEIECIDVDQLESQDEIQSSPAKLKSAFQPVKKSQTNIECIDEDQLESQDEIQSSPAKLKSAFQPVEKSQTEIECIDVYQLESQDEIQFEGVLNLSKDAVIQTVAPEISRTEEVIPSEITTEEQKERTEEEDGICKRFIWGTCEKLSAKCKYKHVFNIPSMIKTLIFCKDFQNSHCIRSDCSLLHTSRDEQVNFELNGVVPPLLIRRYHKMDEKLAAKYLMQQGSMSQTQPQIPMQTPSTYPNQILDSRPLPSSLQETIPSPHIQGHVHSQLSGQTQMSHPPQTLHFSQHGYISPQVHGYNSPQSQAQVHGYNSPQLQAQMLGLGPVHSQELYSLLQRIQSETAAALKMHGHPLVQPTQTAASQLNSDGTDGHLHGTLQSHLPIESSHNSSPFQLVPVSPTDTYNYIQTCSSMYPQMNNPPHSSNSSVSRTNYYPNSTPTSDTARRCEISKPPPSMVTANIPVCINDQTRRIQKYKTDSNVFNTGWNDLTQKRLCEDCVQRKIRYSECNKIIEKENIAEADRQFILKEKLEDLNYVKDIFIDIIGEDNERLFQEYLEGNLNGGLNNCSINSVLKRISRRLLNNVSKDPKLTLLVRALTCERDMNELMRSSTCVLPLNQLIRLCQVEMSIRTLQS